jgi:hypothetical protein
MRAAEDRLRGMPGRAWPRSSRTPQALGTGTASQTPIAEHGHVAARRRGQFRGLRSLSENTWIHPMTGTHAWPIC